MPKKIIINALAALILLPFSLSCAADTYDPLDFERPTSWYFTVIPGVTAVKGAQLLHPTIPIVPAGGGVLTDNLQPGYEFGYSIGAGVGFHLDHNFRLDFLYSYMNNASRSFCGVERNSTPPPSEYPVDGDDLNILTHTIMANLYYDFYPYNLNNIYPYVGLGAGFAFTKATAFSLFFPTYGAGPRKVSVGESGFDTKFAYQTTIGFQRMINENLWVDLHYRWMNVAVPKFFNHRMQVHTLGLGLMGYISDDKRGRFTADYDDVLGYMRTFYVHAHAGGSYFMNNDTGFDLLFIPAQLPSVPTDTIYPTNSSVGTQFKVGYNVGGAIGFYMNDYIRVEVELNHHHARFGRVRGVLGIPTGGGGADEPGVFRGAGFVNMNTFMANGYYDFINVGKKYKPYVGLGLGVARIRHSDVDGFHKAFSDSDIIRATLPGNYATRFAFQLNTGVRKRINKNWLIQWGYRYLVVPRPSVMTHALQDHVFNFGAEYILTPEEEV